MLCPVCKRNDTIRSVVKKDVTGDVLDIVNKCHHCGYESYMTARLLQTKEIKCEGCRGVVLSV